MLKNYLITSLTSCENRKLIKARVSNSDLALLFIPLCGHSCGHRGVSHVEFSQSHSKRLIFYHCCSSPSSFAAAATRCALLALPCPLCFFPFKKRRGTYKFWPPEAPWFGNVMWEPFNDVLLQVL